MARRDVRVSVLVHRAIERELPIAVTLALAMPANDRMDLRGREGHRTRCRRPSQPLITERSVLRLAGERAEKRQAHWQAIAIAACEQCGRNRVPSIVAVQPLTTWLAGLAPAAAGEARLLLGWRDATPWPQAVARVGATLTLLSGPEGGFTDVEEDRARLRGFVSVRSARACCVPTPHRWPALAAIALHAA